MKKYKGTMEIIVEIPNYKEIIDDLVNKQKERTQKNLQELIDVIGGNCKCLHWSVHIMPGPEELFNDLNF